MARPPKPWYWKDRDGYYATVRGERKLLAEGRGPAAFAEAVAELGRLLKAKPEPPPSAEGETVHEASTRFLADCERTLKPLTFEYYTQKLRHLCASHASLPLAELRPKHVDDVIAAKRWAANSQRAFIAACKRLTSWANKRGDLDSDPLAKMKKPREKACEDVPAEADVDKVLAAIKDENFRDIVTAIFKTGCRVSEAYRLEAKHVNLEAGAWVFDSKTGRATGKPRVVYMTPDVADICRKWMERHPTGAIFRCNAGKPWPRQLLSQRMRILRRRLGLGEEVKLKGLRHLFVTDALEKNVAIATVAELAGHTDTRMVSRVYSKLHKRTDHLKSALLAVRGPAGHTDPPPPDSPPSASAPASAPPSAPKDPPASRRGRRRADPG